MADNIKYSQSKLLYMDDGSYSVEISLTKDYYIIIRMINLKTKVNHKRVFIRENVKTPTMNLSMEQIWHILIAGLLEKDKNVILRCSHGVNNQITLHFRWNIPNDIGLSLPIDFTFDVPQVLTNDMDMMKDTVKELSVKCDNHDKELENIKNEFEGAERALNIRCNDQNEELKNVKKELDEVKKELETVKMKFNDSTKDHRFGYFLYFPVDELVKSIKNMKQYKEELNRLYELRSYYVINGLHNKKQKVDDILTVLSDEQRRGTFGNCVNQKGYDDITNHKYANLLDLNPDFIVNSIKNIEQYKEVNGKLYELYSYYNVNGLHHLKTQVFELAKIQSTGYLNGPLKTSNDQNGDYRTLVKEFVVFAKMHPYAYLLDLSPDELVKSIKNMEQFKKAQTGLAELCAYHIHDQETANKVVNCRNILSIAYQKGTFRENINDSQSEDNESKQELNITNQTVPVKAGFAGDDGPVIIFGPKRYNGPVDPTATPSGKKHKFAYLLDSSVDDLVKSIKNIEQYKKIYNNLQDLYKYYLDNDGPVMKVYDYAKVLSNEANKGTFAVNSGSQDTDYKKLKEEFDNMKKEFDEFKLQTRLVMKNLDKNRDSVGSWVAGPNGTKINTYEYYNGKYLQDIYPIKQTIKET